MQNLKQSRFLESDNICKTMTRVCQGKVDYLEKILHEIEPETYHCKPPKKWNDISGGQLYCTGCNQNL